MYVMYAQELQSVFWTVTYALKQWHAKTLANSFYNKQFKFVLVRTDIYKQKYSIYE